MQPNPGWKVPSSCDIFGSFFIIDGILQPSFFCSLSLSHPYFCICETNSQIEPYFHSDFVGKDFAINYQLTIINYNIKKHVLVETCVTSQAFLFLTKTVSFVEFFYVYIRKRLLTLYRLSSSASLC